MRPSGPVTSIQVTGCGTPCVNTTSPAGTPSSRSVERSVTMRGAQRLDGIAPAGRVSLTRTSTTAGGLETVPPKPAAARSAGAQRSAVSLATVRLRSA